MKSAAYALALATAGALIASPAAAYDPCQRATERSQAADQAVYDWINAHCTSGGQCIGNPAQLQRLRQIALDARAARSRACT